MACEPRREQFDFNGLLAVAWVRFVGSGTVAIGDSENVSSVTDNGVGLYTINFTTAFVTANYCYVACARDTAVFPLVMGRHATAAATGSHAIIVGRPFNEGAIDPEECSVAYFGGLT